MRTWFTPVMTAAALLLSACANSPSSPEAWAAPEPLLSPSGFSGVHGVAVGAVGAAYFSADRNNGPYRIWPQR